jgi:hypothetical protein
MMHISDPKRNILAHPSRGGTTSATPASFDRLRSSGGEQELRRAPLYPLVDLHAAGGQHRNSSCYVRNSQYRGVMQGGALAPATNGQQHNISCFVCNSQYHGLVHGLICQFFAVGDGL